MRKNRVKTGKSHEKMKELKKHLAKTEILAYNVKRKKMNDKIL